MAPVKEMSIDEYHALPRKVKRDLERSREKEGLPPLNPEKLRKKMRVNLIADEKLLKASLIVLERNGLTMETFFELSLRKLIEASN